MTKHFAIALAALLCMASALAAADDDTQSGCSKQDELTTVPPASVIRKAEQGEAPDTSAHALELGKFLIVKVPEQQYAKFFVKHDDNIQPTPVLYLNGFALKGLAGTPTGCRNFAFLLQRTEESRDIWGSELFKLDGKDPVPIGIGTVQQGFVTDVGSAMLALPSKGYATGWWLSAMAVLGCLLVWLGIRTGLLRDLPKRPAASEGEPAPEQVPPDTRPFSLARVQMALWLALATGAYIYIWLRTGDTVNVIPSSILTLMGISGATTVLAAVVDTSAAAQNPEQASGNFFRDILSDHDGISFHRFQMMIWTFILGGVFIQKVASTLIMPDFDAQLLGLMGVSSLTYLGFKIPAAASAPASPAPSPSNQQPPAVG